VSTLARTCARVAAVLLLAVAGTVAGATAAGAQPVAAASASPAIGEFHPIQSQFNGHCIQPTSVTFDAFVVQEPCDGSTLQAWFAIPTGTHIYRFINQASGLCLWTNDTLVDGTPLFQDECEVAGGTSVSNAQWATDGTVPIGTRLRSDVHSSVSNFCVTVPSADGQIVTVRTCFGGSGQDWTVGAN
jgi:hypothetical protein